MLGVAVVELQQLVVRVVRVEEDPQDLLQVQELLEPILPEVVVVELVVVLALAVPVVPAS